MTLCCSRGVKSMQNMSPCAGPYLAISPPNRSDAKPGPAILFVHGGPHAAVTNAFAPPLLFLAAAGYTVILPNYRGSSGQGEERLQALPGHVGKVQCAKPVRSLHRQRHMTTKVRDSPL